MIRAIVLLCAASILVFSGCRESTKVTSSEKNDSTTSHAAYNFPHLQGTYRGDFDGSDISLVLRYVSGRHAVGYNTHKGLRRNISGSMQPAAGGFSFKLSEPGDNPYDGVFTFTLDTATLRIKGSWKPANTRNLSTKEFVLKRDWSDTASVEIYGNIYGDSIGKFEFAKEGLCTYRYYPKGGGQLVEVKGNWKLADNVYTIDWSPNTAFPSRRSTFRRIPMEGTDGEENYEVQLVGEGRTLYPDMM
jgi:hypothetical protein